jgi:hypothetical protein
MTLFTSVIVRFLLTGLNLLAFAGFEVVAGAAAQTDDLAKGLVGRWEGQVEGLRRTTEQTLVIESLAKEGETWSVTGVMGSPERRFGAFRGTLERAGGDLVLRFNSAGGHPVESGLAKDGKHLAGHVHRWGPGGGRDLQMKFEKVR